MRAILVVFDSLNRRQLPPYGGDAIAPQFERLAGRTVQFENAYVCSMPCMPARRDLHTGRPNFLYRSWGPLEPFDDSFPELLAKAGVYSHLVTDHQHYFEDGGCTYHNRYSSWEFFRGQEGDKWIPSVADPEWPSNALARNASRDDFVRNNYANREAFKNGTPLPIQQTFDAGLRFLEKNWKEDNWFLQIETFDPHEPFLADEEFRKLYGMPGKDDPLFDWPFYEKVTQTRDQVKLCRDAYYASLSQCDANLGRVLDFMDSHNMWDDTMLIVWTDHGFFLGEREWWGKMRMPWWNELAQIPFFMWDPRTRDRGSRRKALVQPSIDLAPTLLRYFGLEPTEDMLGCDLAPVMKDDTPVRESGIFGNFGGHVNVTDGRYVYMRSTERFEVRMYEYTYMPTRMITPFPPEALRGNVTLREPFRFTKGCSLMKVGNPSPFYEGKELEDRLKADPAFRRHWLYDLERDPEQKEPIEDKVIEERMIEYLRKHLGACDAPEEQWARLGLSGTGN
jgi:arylsulfatase A-like enzyme